ncbi:MAG TPA: DNA circularization N-terminal domain-containing protein [Enterobacteriaceae bacterium]|nr:DNA circularization N-terminal domain-containing protein [Enterobacteriaceae bacterium]
MTWKERLETASFRGVSFHIESENASFGRRVQTHEFPNRDKPYSEDLGRIALRPNITAYVMGDDCLAKRDRLIEALNKPGPGTLIHPTLGKMIVCVTDQIKVSTASNEGRMVRFDLHFVEAGELAYPQADTATANILTSSCSAADEAVNQLFAGFSLAGMPDFLQSQVLDDVGQMLDTLTSVVTLADRAAVDAIRLLKGDISVLLPPPSSGTGFIERVKKLWNAGNRLADNSRRLHTRIKNLSGVALDNGLAPRGLWKTDSATTRAATQQRNLVASVLRTTALSEAVLTVTALAAPAGVAQESTAPTSGWPTLSHPALNNAVVPQGSQTELLSWDALVDLRDTLNVALDREIKRASDDGVFLALRRMKSSLNTDISARLAQTEKTVVRTPEEVTPALVLAAAWYDAAGRETDIIQRNGVAHPGFVPVSALRVPVR